MQRSNLVAKVGAHVRAFAFATVRDGDAAETVGLTVAIEREAISGNESPRNPCVTAETSIDNNQVIPMTMNEFLLQHIPTICNLNRSIYL